MHRGRLLLAMGAGMGALGVALGAFGAHALESYLQAQSPDVAETARLLQTWEVAVRYQMYHALALLFAGLWAASHPSRALTMAGWAFLVGVAIFSGCLYALVLTGVKILGAIVPIGGVLLILGWLALLTGSFAARTAARD
jgi:uncharacterized membrane protein YgdD (TMEM256/DUF423 family)